MNPLFYVAFGAVVLVVVAVLIFATPQPTDKQRAAWQREQDAFKKGPR